MIVSIIGAGLLGKTYGGLLALAGNEVHFLTRSEFKEIKEANCFTLQFSDLKENLIVKSPKLYHHSQELPPSDLVIISLKTVDNDKIPSLLTSCLKQNTIIIVLQNGIENEEWISQHFAHHPIICAVSTLGASKLDATHVEIAFSGELRLAPYQTQNKENCELIVRLFQDAPIQHRVKIFDNPREIRWHKLLWNVPFCLMSIVFDKSTKELVNIEPYISIMTRLLDELIQIAKADNIVIDRQIVSNMLSATKKANRDLHYYPSMYRDFKEGKSIEKEYIIDNVLKIANKANLIVPFLLMLEKDLSILLENRHLKQI